MSIKMKNEIPSSYNEILLKFPENNNNYEKIPFKK
jgi:hypothetical protein